jgi:IS5 family transposase
MRLRERRDSGQSDLFKARLDQIVDLNHPLAKLGGRLAGAFWKSGSARSIASRRCRRG